MSSERAAFFFLNLSTIFIIFLIKEYRKFRLITFILAIICVFFLSLNSSNLTYRMFKGPAKDMGIVKSSNKAVIFSQVTIVYFEQVLICLKKNQFLAMVQRCLEYYV